MLREHGLLHQAHGALNETHPPEGVSTAVGVGCIMQAKPQGRVELHVTVPPEIGQGGQPVCRRDVGFSVLLVI